MSFFFSFLKDPYENIRNQTFLRNRKTLSNAVDETQRPSKHHNQATKINQKKKKEK